MKKVIIIASVAVAAVCVATVIGVTAIKKEDK